MSRSESTSRQFVVNKKASAALEDAKAAVSKSGGTFVGERNGQYRFKFGSQWQMYFFGEFFLPKEKLPKVAFISFTETEGTGVKVNLKVRKSFWPATLLLAGKVHEAVEEVADALMEALQSKK